MECNTTIQYQCNDKERQGSIDNLLSSLFDAKTDLSERKATFNTALQENDQLSGQSMDDFSTVAEVASYGSSLEKRKTGFSAFYFLLSYNADDFCEEIKSILKAFGADKLKCQKEWV